MTNKFAITSYPPSASEVDSFVRSMNANHAASEAVCRQRMAELEASLCDPRDCPEFQECQRQADPLDIPGMIERGSLQCIAYGVYQWVPNLGEL